MPTIAANLSMMFTELAFLDRFEAAAHAGFRHVEFLFPYDHPASEIKARLARFGLTLALFNAPPGDWAKGERGIAIFPERAEEFRAGIATALGYAQALDCAKLHVMAGILAAGADREMAEATYIESLKHAATSTAEHGVTILIEPLNRRDMPGYFLMSVADAARVIGRVGRDSLRLQLDLYHRQITGGDLAEAIKAHWPLVGHIQIAGVPGRHEPDIGEINYPYLFDLIDGLGYTGVIGCEYRPKAGTLAGLGWAKRFLETARAG